MSIRFSHGQFYGHADVRRRVDGFEAASLTATAHEGDVEDHTHDTAHFVLVLSGTYISSARGAPELAAAPTLIFNPAGTRHRDRFLGGVGRFLTLTFDDGYSAQSTEIMKFASRLDDPFSVRAARRLERSLRGENRSFAIEADALQLVAGLNPRSRPDRPPSWLPAAIEMIREGAPDITVAEVAAQVGVHPVHLARVFRDCLGCAPGEVLRGARLERASNLLGRTALALAEVAHEAGFTDQAHLTHAFRKGFGVTPGAWRRDREVASIQYGQGRNR